MKFKNNWSINAASTKNNFKMKFSDSSKKRNQTTKIPPKNNFFLDHDQDQKIINEKKQQQTFNLAKQTQRLFTFLAIAYELLAKNQPPKI